MTATARPRARRGRLRAALGIGVALLVAAPCTVAHGGAAPDPPSQSSASPEDELLATYAPVLAVREQPAECGSGEPYLPMSVEDLFATPGLILRGPDGETVDRTVARRPGRPSPLATTGTSMSPATRSSPDCTYEQLYDAMAAEPVVYGRVVTDPAHPGNVVVQYWFFYVYNDWNDRHEGDWEMIQLVFDAEDASAALLSEPAAGDVRPARGR